MEPWHGVTLEGGNQEYESIFCFYQALMQELRADIFNPRYPHSLALALPLLCRMQELTNPLLSMAIVSQDSKPQSQTQWPAGRHKGKAGIQGQSETGWNPSTRGNQQSSDQRDPR